MDTITELKPLFMRFFQEVDTLNEKIKAQDEEIKKLRAENEIYAKVIRSEVQDTHPSAPTPTPVNEVVDEEENDRSAEVKQVEIKRGRKRKYNTDEERREKRKEYNRNYRQKQKANEDE